MALPKLPFSTTSNIVMSILDEKEDAKTRKGYTRLDFFDIINMTECRLEMKR